MTSAMRQKDIRPAPARIEYKGMMFLITDRPSDINIQNYIVVRIPQRKNDIKYKIYGCFLDENNLWQIPLLRFRSIFKRSIICVRV